MGSSEVPTLGRALCLVERTPGTAFKFLIIYKYKVPHLHFALGLCPVQVRQSLSQALASVTAAQTQLEATGKHIEVAVFYSHFPSCSYFPLARPLAPF